MAVRSSYAAAANNACRILNSGSSIRVVALSLAVAWLGTNSKLCHRSLDGRTTVAWSNVTLDVKAGCAVHVGLTPPLHPD